MEEVRLGTIGSGVIVHSVLGGVRETEGVRLEVVYSRAEDRAAFEERRRITTETVRVIETLRRDAGLASV